jgi:hypothetical protein
VRLSVVADRKEFGAPPLLLSWLAMPSFVPAATEIQPRCGTRPRSSNPRVIDHDREGRRQGAELKSDKPRRASDVAFCRGADAPPAEEDPQYDETRCARNMTASRMRLVSVLKMVRIPSKRAV